MKKKTKKSLYKSQISLFHFMIRKTQYIHPKGEQGKMNALSQISNFY